MSTFLPWDHRRTALLNLPRYPAYHILLESVSELRSPRAERSQASQKESDRSNLDQGFAAGRQALIIASQTPVPDQPAQSAFHFPSVPLDLEASREANQFAIDDGPWVRFGHNFGVPTQMHFDPGNERPSRAAVSEQMRKARETASQLLQEQGSLSTIDEPSRMNLDGEQQSEGINQNMPLATIDFFSAIKAAFAASHRTGLDRLAIDDGSPRFGIATCLGSHMFTQGSHGLLPGAIQLPLTEVILDRFSVGQIMGHLPPRTAGS